MWRVKGARLDFHRINTGLNSSAIFYNGIVTQEKREASQSQQKTVSQYSKT
jgi:hypothetical protein